MTEYTLPYGTTNLKFHIPDRFQMDLLLPKAPEPLEDTKHAIQSALSSPIGERSLLDFSGIDTIGIAINDKTRPLPQPNPLAFLLAALIEAGFSRQNIKLFIGSGDIR